MNVIVAIILGHKIRMCHHFVCVERRIRPRCKFRSPRYLVDGKQRYCLNFHFGKGLSIHRLSLCPVPRHSEDCLIILFHLPDSNFDEMPNSEQMVQVS